MPLHELTEFEFIKLLQLNLNLDSQYTILFQYTLYERCATGGTYLMLGPQVGISVRETHNFKYYKELYSHYSDLLSAILERYDVRSPDFIVIYLKELILEDTLKITVDPTAKIVLNKGIINVGETKRNFNNNILPLTYNEKYFGSLLQENLRLEYLTKLIIKLNENKSCDLRGSKRGAFLKTKMSYIPQLPKVEN